MVARLNLSFYGTCDAAMNWTAAYTNFLISIGFEKVCGCPCSFYNKKDLAMTVHGGDSTSTGSTTDLNG